MIQPYADRVLVKPDPPVEKTGAIFLPETAQAKQQVWWGTVVAVGKKIEGLCELGGRLLYSRYAGFKVAYEGTEYMLLPESDILAVEKK